jgi:tetratricopeptide (TPR) repeat protein
MNEAAALTEDLFRRAQAANRLPQAAEGFVGIAVAQATLGREDEARRQYARLLEAGPLGPAALDEVMALAAMLGDARLADTHLDRALEHMKTGTAPSDAVANENAVRALDALAHRRYEAALTFANLVVTQPSPSQRNAEFVAGLAELALNRWDAAAKSFATMVASPGKIGLSPLIATSYVMLGRAHAGAGRTADARRAYDEAFRIWKDADPDLPLLVDARKEYDALK